MALIAEPRNDKYQKINEKRPGGGTFWESGDPFRRDLNTEDT